MFTDQFIKILLLLLFFFSKCANQGDSLPALALATALILSAELSFNAYAI